MRNLITLHIIHDYQQSPLYHIDKVSHYDKITMQNSTNAPAQNSKALCTQVIIK